MARTTLAKSKTRIICLTDDEEGTVTGNIGNGSRTGGIRRMLELVKLMAKKDGTDEKTAIKNAIAALNKYHDA